MTEHVAYLPKTMAAIERLEAALKRTEERLDRRLERDLFSQEEAPVPAPAEAASVPNPLRETALQVEERLDGIIRRLEDLVEER